MKELLNRKATGYTEKLPIKVLQFGEGNFLRAFVDYVIDKLNEKADFQAGVAVVQPLANGLIEALNKQEGLYTLFMKGIKKNKEIQEQRVISAIQKGINPYNDYTEYLALAQEENLAFVISNTTEAGIAFDENDQLNQHPHKSFPAKLTALLYKRYQCFDGASEKGLTIIPCELINHNADTLKEIILKYASHWELEEGFLSWIENHNSFHNTLVDRIVPGYPKHDIEQYEHQLSYKDNLIVSAEVFFLWVIEGGKNLQQKIPFNKIDENIHIVNDMQPYRTRKVRILNGAHTTMVPFSILYGNKTVKETIDNSFTGKVIKEAIFEEVIPTLDLPEEELNTFAEETFDRFRNPFIKHQLASIALNSISKFKVRVLPSLLTYQKKCNRLPLRLTFAFACLIRFYEGNWNGKTLPTNDDTTTEQFIKTAWELHSYQEITEKILTNTNFWNQDLTQIPDLKDAIAMALELIENNEIEKAYTSFVSNA